MDSFGTARPAAPIDAPNPSGGGSNEAIVARIEGRRGPRTWRVFQEGSSLWLSTQPASHFRVDMSRAAAAQAVLRQAARSEPSPRLEVDADDPAALESLLLNAGLSPQSWRQRRPLPALGLHAGDQLQAISRRIPVDLRLGLAVWFSGLALAALGLGSTPLPPAPQAPAAGPGAVLTLPPGSLVGLLDAIAQKAMPTGIGGFAQIDVVAVSAGGTAPAARREIRLVLAKPAAIPVLGEAKAAAAVSDMQRLEALLTAMPGGVSTPRPLDVGRGYTQTFEIPNGATFAPRPTVESLRATAQATGLVLVTEPTAEGIRVLGERIPAALAMDWLVGQERSGPLAWQRLRLERVTEHEGNPLPEGLIRLEGVL